VEMMESSWKWLSWYATFCVVGENNPTIKPFLLQRKRWHIFFLDCVSVLSEFFSPGPPQVITKAPSIYVNFGWPVTLTCCFRYVDTARASLRWFKGNNKSNVLTGHHTINAITTNRGTVEYSLVIENTTKHDLGCYCCHVNTSYGTNSTTVCIHHSDTSKGIPQVTLIGGISFVRLFLDIVLLLVQILLIILQCKSVTQRGSKVSE